MGGELVEMVGQAQPGELTDPCGERTVETSPPDGRPDLVGVTIDDPVPRPPVAGGRGRDVGVRRLK
jgi:hypothetical protein